MAEPSALSFGPEPLIEPRRKGRDISLVPKAASPGAKGMDDVTGASS